MTEMVERMKAAEGLEAAIAEFHAALPGWWYSLGDCSVSADASCGPDRQWQDAHLLSDPVFDDGFHADFAHPDFAHPATMAEALRNVMEQGLAARTAAPATPEPRP